jgi:hypothetical protein
MGHAPLRQGLRGGAHASSLPASANTASDVAVGLPVSNASWFACHRSFDAVASRCLIASLAVDDGRYPSFPWLIVHIGGPSPNSASWSAGFGTRGRRRRGCRSLPAPLTTSPGGRTEFPLCIDDLQDVEQACEFEPSAMRVRTRSINSEDVCAGGGPASAQRLLRRARVSTKERLARVSPRPAGEACSMPTRQGDGFNSL